MIKRNYSKLSLSAYLIEIAIILCILCSVYLIIAWASYSPFDQGWSVATSQTEVNNKAGFLGAWVIDLCFSLFGQVAHFLPFLLLLTALLLLRAQWKEEFSFFKTITKLIGLLLLLCGLCVLWTLFFTNNIHYLAGGVLGSWLVAYLFPTLGLFGTFMLAFIVAVIGFLFNSGLSLIMLLGSSYRWLTEKYDENDDTDQHMSTNDVITTIDELEPVYFPYLPQNEVNQEVDSVTLHIANDEYTTSVTEIMSSEELIKQAINARESVILNDSNRLEEDVTLVDKSAVVVDETIENKENIIDLPNFTDYRISETVDLPKVSISTQPTNIKIELDETQSKEKALLADQEDNNDPLLAELAKQFELREQQRLAEMAERAKALGAEEAFEAILGDQALSITTQNDLSNNIQRVDTNTTLDDGLGQVSATPSYRPYENTLIHPLLQPKQLARNIPKTPLPSLDLLTEPQQQKMNISREKFD